MLGIFRLGRDVFPHEPDLVFLDFACNGEGGPLFRDLRAGKVSPENVWPFDEAHPGDLGYRYFAAAATAPPAADAIDLETIDHGRARTADYQ